MMRAKDQDDNTRCVLLTVVPALFFGLDVDEGGARGDVGQPVTPIAVARPFAVLSQSFLWLN